MNKIIMTAVITLAFGLVSGSVMAKHHGGGNGGGHKGKMMERIDTDGNGSVSKAEFIAKHEGMFAKMDKDGNGSLSKEELKNAHEHMKEKRSEMREEMKERRSAEQ